MAKGALGAPTLFFPRQWLPCPSLIYSRNRLIFMYMEVDMSEESVPKSQYTEEFKLEAVRLADSVGGRG